MKYSSQKNKNILKISLLVLAILLVAVGVTFVHINNVREAQETSSSVASVSSQDNAKGNASSKKSSTESGTGTKDSSTAPSTPPSSPPATPYGNFVSNHRPGQNGTSTSEKSVCNTTPGATCNIVFTNTEGVTKDLGKQIADSSGAVIWSWDINGSNIGPGAWTIKAVAEQSGQTSTATDTIKLEVL